MLVHGLGAHSGRWTYFAEFFAAKGFSSYALELKGFGEEREVKVSGGYFNTYFKDIKGLYDVVRSENRPSKIFLVGESMGGLVSFMEAIARPHLFDGLVCVSPAFKSRLKFSFFEYVGILFSLFFNSTRLFHMPFDPAMCTRDTVVQETMKSDEREYRMASPKLLFDIVFNEVKATLLEGKIDIPVLFLLAGSDELTDPALSKKVFENLAVRDKKIVLYPEMRHALTIELGREKVFGDMLEWLGLHA